MISRRETFLGLAIGMMTLTVVGPTPGYVGTCAAPAAAVPEPNASCRRIRSIECTHEQAAGRLSDSAYVTCQNNVEMRCLGVNWTATCTPTQAQIDACYYALGSRDRLATPVAAFPECVSSLTCLPPNSGTQSLVVPMEGI